MNIASPQPKEVLARKFTSSDSFKFALAKIYLNSELFEKPYGKRLSEKHKRDNNVMNTPGHIYDDHRHISAQYYTQC